jgi:hypothetical protein
MGMGCVLHVTGANLAPSLVLDGTGLQPYAQYRSGDLQTVGRKKGEPWEYGGFKLLVSDADDLKQQIRDASDFLRNNFNSLRIALSAETVEDARLDFGYFHRPVVAQFDYLPPDFLRLAADLGIGVELSLYPADVS